jgi:hypothetical protein
MTDTIEKLLHGLKKDLKRFEIINCFIANNQDFLKGYYTDSYFNRKFDNLYVKQNLIDFYFDRLIKICGLDKRFFAFYKAKKISCEVVKDIFMLCNLNKSKIETYNRLQDTDFLYLDLLQKREYRTLKACPEEIESILKSLNFGNFKIRLFKSHCTIQLSQEFINNLNELRNKRTECTDFLKSLTELLGGDND